LFLFSSPLRSACTGLKLDIFFYYADDAGGYWNGGTQARTGNKYKYMFGPFVPRYTSLLGEHVRVPFPPLPFVQANYGTTAWQVPVKQWDWKASPPNVQPNGRWPEEDWAEVVQCKVCRHKIDLARFPL
jgi:ADP-heptose:LPS heptosyltransferase